MPESPVTVPGDRIKAAPKTPSTDDRVHAVLLRLEEETQKRQELEKRYEQLLRSKWIGQNPEALHESLRQGMRTGGPTCAVLALLENEIQQCQDAILGQTEPYRLYFYQGLIAGLKDFHAMILRACELTSPEGQQKLNRLKGIQR